MTYSALCRAAAVVAAGSLLLPACTSRPATASLGAAAPNQFAADTVLRRIATAQDERRTPALLPYLNRPEEAYRRAAAEALASVQDKAATPALLALLQQDAEPSVRREAAYALGQTADSTAEAVLVQRIAAEPDGTVRRYVLEALGRCTSRSGLASLTRLPPALAPDTAALSGQAWGLYRAGLRGLTSEAAVSRLVQLLGRGNPTSARLAAANALARTRGLNLAPYAAALGATAQQDAHYAVRSGAAAALSKAATDPTVPPLLASLARRDPDYRVRVSALRALNATMYAPVKEAVWSALTDANAQVALSAAEFFLAHATNEPGGMFLEKANRLENWRARATLLAAALRQQSPEQAAIRRAVQERYTAAADPYEKGYLLKALGEDPAAFDFVQQATFAPNQPLVIGTYGMEALVALGRQPNFPAGRYPEFALALRRGVLSGDVAVMGTAAEAIRDPKLKLQKLLPNPDFLLQARDRLTLPRDLEAWQSLQQTIDFLQNRTTPTATPVAAATSHPIDWGLVSTIPAGQRVVVHTGKGDIVLRLLVEQAPGSVASFVALTRQGFYNGKNFHRVVPNFVAQGGCPRGDGWGSSDYNLRSEFADLRYGEGAVGLASAGKDTESCQWFITHAPTPHLDGRYTIFAQVVQGMDVVSRLDIGDRIDRVELMDSRR
ncbi:cyclophilin family peptidyl-prolyl cis-trans isomerase/HEAT repeat protein [Hymenobacter luteus]|uniref:peptidylprolyl isomerase n=2 Tax=Hymenobacter TaxID=89966 RepID=A0A7W9T1E9_9BACT|nr:MULTISPECIES: peptidylprolyl isomerase [Hymenobacter]MBB4600588.1 cyclophilin family peptidyl-prolyl cis-trans isomerase/HEAT repeat protein [Hymenobacter latericoloratus]MBB6059205.1 cyclophilin family peptidyl-prolyl cis-trans isomerase/HEAT repeat protein [Hymenobacter luteus]